MASVKVQNNSWWGPPRKIGNQLTDRKVSWLELFFDLVYVIAISTANHYLVRHQDINGFLDYVYMFTMVYWGWINGSLYYDLHGSPGVRTSLMTLWQMLIIAGMVVTLNISGENLLFNVTIALMVMQLYITYLWWSVGFYDKVHRKLNRPYTLIYLISLGILFSTLFSSQPYTRILFYTSLALNFLPPLVTVWLRRDQAEEFRLSSSMTERLGLFTIILFGEVIVGVVNGASAMHAMSWNLWIQFALAISIVFSLWWIFFGLISDRTCKKGMLNSLLMELVYIPTMMGLGMTGVAFDGLFESFQETVTHTGISFSKGLGYAESLFLIGIVLLLYFIEYPEPFEKYKSRLQIVILFGLMLLFSVTYWPFTWSLLQFLIFHLLVLLFMISIITIAGRQIRRNLPAED